MSLHAFEPSTYARRIPLPHAAGVRQESRTSPEERADRKSLYKAAEEAAEALSLPRSATAVLRSLVSCYGEQHLAQGLMVWPSNTRIKANTQFSERAIRSAIVVLRQAGLLIAVDSPNGKRYARRRDNSVIQAFGFDLSPLFSRRREFADAVARRQQEAIHLRHLCEDLSAARRTLAEIIEALRALDRTDLVESLELDLHETRVPRGGGRTIRCLTPLLVRAEAARNRAEQLHFDVSLEKESAVKGGQDSRHKETNAENSAESCQQRSGDKSPQHSKHSGAYGANIWASDRGGSDTVRSTEQVREAEAEDFGELEKPITTMRSILNPALWRSACPALGPDFKCAFGTIEEIARAGREAAFLIALSQDARALWQRRLGPVFFPLVAAYVYQICEDDQHKPDSEIRNSGGFFVHVARGLMDGQRDLARDVMALRRRRRVS